MTSPARFLEQHQRETYLRLGLPLPNEAAHLEAISVTNRQLLQAQGIKSRRKQRQYAAAERKQYRVDRSECPTKYESPSMYQRVTALAGEIHATAERNFTDPPQWPLIGTVPMGQLNAMTIPIPGTADYVMLFESSLLIFDLLLTKTVALAIPGDIVEIVTTMANDGADAGEIAMAERAAIVRQIATHPEPSHRFYQL